jgi:CubicO group peptidase (beta-lactamase class C family)
MLAAVILAFPNAIHAQKPAGFDAAWRDIVTGYHRTLDEQGVVGSALWVLRGGETLAREFHGFADLETQRRIDENTIFHWASITKTFTGIAILQLRDRGRLSLEDPVVKHLPELRAVHNPFGPMEAITIRHLMTHSAGFRSPTWPWGGSEAWHPHEPTEWSQIVAMLPYTEILFEPGSRHSYSNPGIIFLGRIIELLTGDDYEVYVDKNILKPLGMYRSYFDVTPYHLLPWRSNNFTVKGGKPVANGLDFDTGITTSNGGLNAPITDMAKYLAFLAGDRGRAVEYDVLLRRSSLEEMWREQLPIPPATPPAAAANPAESRQAVTREAIGLVYFLFEHGGVRTIGHTGSQKAFLSFFYLDPATGAATIAAFNTDRATAQDRPDTRAILNGLRADVVGKLFPLFR